MFRKTASALALSASFLIAGPADNAAAQYATQAAHNGSNMGGGFIELLFGGHQQQMSPYHQPHQPPQYAPQAQPYRQPQYQQPQYQGAVSKPADVPGGARAGLRAGNARATLGRSEVSQAGGQLSGTRNRGTVVIDTPSKFLYLVQGDGRALRYGIGVGRPGFTWSGVKTVSMKKEWPSWTPPAEMLKRRPDLPRFMEGGPDNPLGARAMYLGSTLYRIHGSNEPWTIGTSVSSGCIRMRNEDVIDLYNRVKVGTRVVVI